MVLKHRSDQICVATMRLCAANPRGELDSRRSPNQELQPKAIWILKIRRDSSFGAAEDTAQATEESGAAIRWRSSEISSMMGQDGS